LISILNTPGCSAVIARAGALVHCRTGRTALALAASKASNYGMFRLGSAAVLTVLLVLGLPAATHLALNTAPPATILRIEDWLGVWRDGQNVVWISLNPDNQVTVVGAAYSTNPAIPRSDLRFQTALYTDRISFMDESDPCAADFHNNARGELTVTDNGQCGGARFNGVYIHQ
jgi:hypothetical protein